MEKKKIDKDTVVERKDGQECSGIETQKWLYRRYTLRVEVYRDYGSKRFTGEKELWTEVGRQFLWMSGNLVGHVKYTE